MNNILITGSSGFIGGALVENLRKNKNNNLYLIINKNKNNIKSKNIKFIYCSLLNKKKLEKVLSCLNITHVIHCAWIGVNSKNRNNSKQNLNILIMQNLLNAIKNIKVNCLISIGSQAEYGAKINKVLESSKLKPITKYGKTKVKILKYTKLFCKKNKIRFVWLRVFTGYGPNCDNNWIIPSTIFKLINNQKTKFTSGNQIYNFIYVSDIAYAIIKSLHNRKANGIFNLGSEKSYTIKHVIKLIFKKLKIKKKPVFGGVSYRNDQIMKFLPSVLKIKKTLKWQPQYSISEGLNKTIKFIKKSNIV